MAMRRERDERDDIGHDEVDKPQVKLIRMCFL